MGVNNARARGDGLSKSANFAKFVAGSSQRPRSGSVAGELHRDAEIELTKHRKATFLLSEVKPA